MITAQVVTTDPMSVVYIPMRGPYAQTPEGLGKLYGWIQEQGLRPAGMPAAVYLTAPSETPEAEAVWELWAPVEDSPERPADDSGIGIRRVGPTTVATTMHKGPYESVAPTYESLWRWVAENGYVPDGPPMERYYSDPVEVPPEEYLTEILLPVRRA